jgi:hypothetical protein
VAGGVVLTGGLLATSAFGQDGSRLALSIFQGDLNGISLGGWGSGAAEPAREAAMSGTTGLKITTHGLYQGGRIDLREPIDLTNILTNPYAYLRFQMKYMPGQNAGFGGGSGFPGEGGPPGGFSGSSGPPGGFSGSSGPPGGFAGGEGFGGGFGGASAAAPTPFRNIRFVLVMADGSQHELYRPADLPPTDNPAGFAPLAFPFAAVKKKMGDKMPTGDAAKLKSIAIFGDRYQQFYIGEINILADQTEITVQPLDEQIFFAGQTTVFAGSAEGGATTLKYSWDFNAADGIQEDAVGRVVTHVFPKSGNTGSQQASKEYTITLTVTDVDGLKKPASTTLKADVSD